MRATRLLFLGPLFAMGCGGEPVPGETPKATDPWGDLAVAPAADRSSDPAVLEVDLDARAATREFEAGKQTPVWAYNGTIPGPLLDAKVGDELVVHFTNHLPEETTIHWHGVRVPNEMDGVMGLRHPLI